MYGERLEWIIFWKRNVQEKYTPAIRAAILKRKWGLINTQNKLGGRSNNSGLPLK